MSTIIMSEIKTNVLMVGYLINFLIIFLKPIEARISNTKDRAPCPTNKANIHICWETFL